ncbi:hypothetical protein EON65_18965 [archaeon]|nr:MAG: hypothetical protein EON65_18965 [archaeon]
MIRSAELTKTQTSIELLSSDEDSVASEMSLGQDSSVVVLPDDRIVRGILQCSSLDGEVGDIVTFSNSIVGNTVIVELLKFLLKALQPLCEQQEGSEQHEKDRRDFQLMIYSALFIKVLTHLIGGFAISKRSLVSLLDQRASSVIVQALSKFITWCSEEVSAVIPSSGAVPSIVRYIIPNDQSDGFVGVPRIPCLYSFMTEAFYEVIPVYNDWIGSITKSFSKENNRRADVLDKKFGILRTKLQNLAKAIKNKKLHQVCPS